ncbi:AraC family transcriptional regulator [Acinetobacter sp. WCHAc010052]|uniref:AraC family transcriptional regulator n=1 Tax=Acinetobacter sp. WCHAc010052 TaxID=2004647 RepID=UPI000B3BE6FA|nr:helix-turn-helix transcriptional regulator [Acinetobacter sp. WCHAc010052]AXY59050.1 AraC family transcriptional regulator [Acinetobacter sp. WCHAc010052]
MGTRYSHGYLNYPVYAFSQDYRHGHVEDWHEHERIQLIHTLTGVIRIQTEAGTWVTPPGRGVWIPAGQSHSLHISGDVLACGVFIDPLARADLIQECRVVAVPPLLRELITAAQNIQEEIHPFSRNERVLELILDEVRQLYDLPFNLPEPRHPGLLALCTAVRAQLNLPWSIEHAAEHVHMSSKTFSRHFQKETGLNFSQWLRQAKLLHAMTELALKKPVLGVALDLGYDSPSAFSAMFRRETGMSPSEYIQQFQ